MSQGSFARFALLPSVHAMTKETAISTTQVTDAPRPPETGPWPHASNSYSRTSTQEAAIATPTLERGTQRDVLNHANFGLLKEDKGRFGSFGVSVGINLAIVAAILAFTINQVHEEHVRRQEQLVYLAPEPKPYVPPVPKVKLPPIPPLPRDQPKIQPPVPTPVVEPPKPEPIKVAVKQPTLPNPAPRPVVAPPKPVVGVFKSPAAPAAQAPKVAAAQAAGFGAPTGVQANPNANRPSQLATVGAFGAAANSNQGAAARQGAVTSSGFGSGAPSGSPNGSARGVVSTSGFGSGTQASGAPGGRGTVASTGFGQGSAPAGASAAARAQQPVVTSIVLLSKPVPQYTEEAREAHVQGDVTLEVRFTADGQVQVLRVVSGLGHGLDEQAQLAASRIRFKPATRDGKPVDQVVNIHISFQQA
ncbi:energy transducer TonB [Acidipila sp. EB88]|uniref:energy transducer TonB n=1 Tax=Acidipila sp. EB88 TaxID=2305226 RepID=UPI000F5DC860|nr:energy transducer TonB [Acidipila sp. EB88]RRA48859.1 TonB family protein [Acidipila sp. EB88]